MRTRLVHCLIPALLGSGLATTSAHAETPLVRPYLVKDLVTTGNDWTASPYVTAGGATYMRGTSLAAGVELWKTDGTVAGTVMVKDLNPGANSSSPTELTAVGNLLYFSASVPSAGTELFKTDGTAEGTSMVTDLTLLGSSQPQNLTAWGSKLVFSAHDGAHGRDLWITDGTTAGTRMVKDFPLSGTTQPTFSEVTAVGDFLYFAVSYGTGLPTLWRSDGTSTGTISLLPTTLNSPRSFVAYGGSTWFFAKKSSDASTVYLWKSGGTAATTAVFNTAAQASTYQPPNLVVMGNALYFNQCTGYKAVKLWRTTGTAASTTALGTVNGMGDLTTATLGADTSPALYFSGSETTNGTELWKSDGTPAGTRLFADIWPGSGDSYPDRFTPVAGGKMFYLVGDNGGDGNNNLRITDGSGAGTLVKNFPGPVGSLTALGSKIIFSGRDANRGLRPWVSDGTEAGTFMLRDFTGNAGSNPDLIREVNGKLYFYAANEVLKKTDVMHYTDGTAEGTRNVNGFYLKGTQTVGESVSMEGELIFPGTDLDSDVELWRSRGSITSVIQDLRQDGSSSPQLLTVCGDNLFFTANNTTFGRELYRSGRGRTDNFMVTDIVEGTGSPGIANLAAVGSTLFFTTGGNPWTKLWKSQGFDTDTVVVRDFGTATKKGLLAAGGLAYFIDSSLTPKIWCSDGTSVGTRALATLPSNYTTPADSLSATVAVGSRAFIATHSLAASRVQLWSSDGTAAGTSMVLDTPGTLAQTPAVQRCGNRAVVCLTNNARRELWSSDGTAAGTRQIYSQSQDSIGLNRFTASDTRLYFLAGTSIPDSTLWKTDGTPEGTSQVPLDLPGTWSTSSGRFAIANGRLFFPLSTEDYGSELYAVKLADLRTPRDIYVDWATTAGLSDAAADPLATPQADGVPNLLKYAFFLDPAKPGAATVQPGTGTTGLPAISLAAKPGGKTYLRVEYLRRPGSGLTYTPQVSTSLASGSFTPITATPVVQTAGDRERVIVDHPIDPAITPAVFGRVEVSGF